MRRCNSKPGTGPRFQAVQMPRYESGSLYHAGLLNPNSETVRGDYSLKRSCTEYLPLIAYPALRCIVSNHGESINKRYHQCSATSTSITPERSYQVRSIKIQLLQLLCFVCLVCALELQKQSLELISSCDLEHMIAYFLWICQNIITIYSNSLERFFISHKRNTGKKRTGMGSNVGKAAAQPFCWS